MVARNSSSSIVRGNRRMTAAVFWGRILDGIQVFECGDWAVDIETMGPGVACLQKYIFVGLSISKPPVGCRRQALSRRSVEWDDSQNPL